ncbi:MAG: NAD(P)-dependent oxidoreductase, partial [Mycobacteriaceae bacterium]
AKSKQAQIIINAARGGLVDEQALADAIRGGRIRGAGFDVYATEPCTDSPLYELDEVVVTPHLGASTEEAQDRAGTDVAASVLKSLAGDFVPDAVNVTGGTVSEEVALWLGLSAKLGTVATGLLDAPVTAVNVEARGELSGESVDALGLSALRGVFAGVVDEQVTFVNTPQIAQERGVELTVTTADESVTHRSVLEVTVVTGDGASVSVIGALTGLDRVDKIVRINDRGLDLRAEGLNLFLTYNDQPGALGTVGTFLGRAGINIDAAALSQNEGEGSATLVLRVDKEIGQDLVDQVADALDASRAVLLDLS